MRRRGRASSGVRLTLHLHSMSTKMFAACVGASAVTRQPPAPPQSGAQPPKRQRVQRKWWCHLEVSVDDLFAVYKHHPRGYVRQDGQQADRAQLGAVRLQEVLRRSPASVKEQAARQAAHALALLAALGR